MAEDEPETVQSLLRNEMANNWIAETGLSIAEVREKLGIAVGELNVVFAPCPGQHRVPSEHKMPSARAPQPANGILALSTQPEDTPWAHTNRCRSGRPL